VKKQSFFDKLSLLSVRKADFLKTGNTKRHPKKGAPNQLPSDELLSSEAVLTIQNKQVS